MALYYVWGGNVAKELHRTECESCLHPLIVLSCRWNTLCSPGLFVKCHCETWHGSHLKDSMFVCLWWVLYSLVTVTDGRTLKEAYGATLHLRSASTCSEWITTTLSGDCWAHLTGFWWQLNEAFAECLEYNKHWVNEWMVVVWFWLLLLEATITHENEVTNFP